MRLRSLPVILLGMALIGVLTPLTQFLTILTINSSLETANPVGWAVGLVFSLALAVLVVRLLARRTLLSKQSLAILYAMLALAVPLMNLGLARPFYLAITAVLREYVAGGTNTYRTAYSVLDPAWFPVVPTPEGLAWNQADRLLRLLRDPELAANRSAARRELALALEDDPAHAGALAGLIDRLGPDEAAALLAQAPPAALERSGLGPRLSARAAELNAAGAAAAGRLIDRLAEFDEAAASYLPSNLAAATPSARRRLEAARRELPAAESAALEARVGALAAHEAEARRLVAALGQGDWARVRGALADRALAEFQALPPARQAEVRSQFVYRLSNAERSALMLQDGTNGPDQNLGAFEHSLWREPAERQARQQQTLLGNLREVVTRLPWHLWWRPLLLWASLFTLIFLFLACLAEWLRRKWVDRENLTFPQVELADHLIRHDFRLELAADVRDPEPRKRAFYPLFWGGFALGCAILFAEALGHYGFLGQRPLLLVNLNEVLFERIGGAVKEMPFVILAVSPIVVGLAYLLSLEVSLSIWVSFLVVTIATWWTKLGLPQILDSAYTGFDGGKLFPFYMEQLLGACAAFALFLVWRAWRAPRTTGDPAAGAYVPPRVAQAGLILLPIGILALLWQIGVRHVPLLLLVGAVLLVQAIVTARARAETGLPPTPAFYEMTKLPMVFGMTGSTGGRTFAAYTNIVFLPVTLLLRTLPQQLENIELARRYRIPYRTMAIAALAAFAAAVTVGLISFLLFSYALGSDFYGLRLLPPSTDPSAQGIMTYPLWVSHFLGEPGLATFDRVNWLRMTFIAIGAGVVGLLLVLRWRFLRFPIHPIGYIVILLGIYFNWTTTHMPPQNLRWETTTLWGGVFVAWLVKRLIVNYGGMNAYRRGKPFFIGLAVGGLMCLFAVNAVDLVASFVALQVPEHGSFLKAVTENAPFWHALF